MLRFTSIVATALELLFASISLHTVEAQAQGVVSDGTLNTRVTGNNSDFTIVEGTRSGVNLFHSFQEFSIPTNGHAIFNLTAQPSITSIFARVTGTNISNVNGVIQTIGGSNPSLFLMNPNGIVFGPQARLDIGGSFVGTTAQGIRFNGGELFDSSTPANALLNVQVPIGLQFGFRPAAIQVQGKGHGVTAPNTRSAYRRNPNLSELKVLPGRSLALVGGPIDMMGGVLVAPEGRIELGSVGDNAWVGLFGFGLDYSQVTDYAPIRLSERSLIDVSGQANGTIQIRSQDLTLNNGSILLAQNSGIGPKLELGAIRVNSSGTVLLEGGTRDRTIGSGIEVQTLGSREGATIDINARNLIVSDIARVSSLAFGTGSTGDIRIQASEGVSIESKVLNDPAQVAVILSLTSGPGNSGDIQIRTPLLRATNNAVISAATLGAGAAGNMDVESDRIELSRGGTIGSSSFVSGNAGTLNLNARQIELKEGGLISTNSLGSGNAGSIVIDASESLILTGSNTNIPSAVRSTVRSAPLILQQLFGAPANATGNGGSITIRSPQVLLNNQAQINVRNEGSGEGGNIDIQTERLVLDDRTSLVAATKVGTGGDIRLRSQIIALRRESSISVTAGSRGQGGTIDIDTDVLLGLENSDIVANAVLGTGGEIRIAADQIYGLQYRSQLTPENDITAISQFGLNGSVRIQDLRLNPNVEAIPLPIALPDSNRRISDRCNDRPTNRFIITGRGGLPKTPTWNLDSNRGWRDTRVLRSSLPIQVSAESSDEQMRSSLLEMSGWHRNSDGTIDLVAPGSNQSSKLNPMAFVSCSSTD